MKIKKLSKKINKLIKEKEDQINNLTPLLTGPIPHFGQCASCTFALRIGILSFCSYCYKISILRAEIQDLRGL